MFRRRTEPEPVTQPQVTKPGGKGRPTPKRAEAERARMRPITAPPQDRKEAYRRTRARQAAEREKARAGMARGEEKYLLKRDKGPVRGFARDYVDSRRTVGSYLMWSMFVIVALSFLPFAVTKLMMLVLPPLLLGVVLVEALLISTKVKSEAAARFPGEDTKGVGLYAAMRAMQIRRMRIPAARLGPGDKNNV